MITHQFEVIKANSDNVVVGKDITKALGIILSFKDKVVQ